MTEDNRHSRVPPDTSSSAAETQPSEPKKRLEDLLIDDDARKTTFKELASQEVKSGSRVGGSLRWPLVVLALLIIAVVGVVVGWYQYGDLLSGHDGTQSQVRVEKRMAVPARPQPHESVKQTSADEPTEGVAGGHHADVPPEQLITDVAVEEVTDRVVEDIKEETLEQVVATPAVAPDTLENDIVVTEKIAPEEMISEAQQPLVTETPVAPTTEAAYRVLVGPFISQRDLERATLLLREHGFDPQQERGSGRVDMIRLLEGIYPLAQAQLRLEELRKDYPSAFLLPDGDRWALYIGSFSDRERARRQQRELAEDQIQVAQVDSQLTIEGPLLVVVRSDLKAAEDVVAQVNESGLRARIEVER